MRGIFLLAVLAFVLSAAPAHAWPESDRTSNRTVLGDILYPKWLMATPEHYEFLPLKSNHDAQNQHPAQWQGQDWDPAMWDKNWTPQIAIKKFYEARIFSAQYLAYGQPVLELGPTFYKLSDLDQRRTLKLLADHSGVFDKGHKIIVLRDWATKDEVGNYDPKKGMHLL